MYQHVLKYTYVHIALTEHVPPMEVAGHLMPPPPVASSTRTSPTVSTKSAGSAPALRMYHSAVSSLAVGESVTKCPSLKMLKDTYDHSCYGLVEHIQMNIDT